MDDRRILNGIVWWLRTGTAWRDVPERYGPWTTPHTRFRPTTSTSTRSAPASAASGQERHSRADAHGRAGRSGRSR
ncbi:hypothetical protein DMH12_06140 [Streptomyces sp. WAC 04229]|uniref:transposase n=1 Tax=Streptomyces sp. WAC 04229 TaxID=2203206 RepID=UPI000F7389B7|nr:hypothetical protein DMH12_06140 [Streptomyces sp. WAC 04229]